MGTSRITSFEEGTFLQRPQASQLPVSTHRQELTKALLILKQEPEWALRAKGGWSVAPKYANGWWVG